jgi:hypothetical protein
MLSTTRPRRTLGSHWLTSSLLASFLLTFYSPAEAGSSALIELCHQGTPLFLPEVNVGTHLDHGDWRGSCALRATVNCPEDSIGDAIRRAETAAGQLIVEVNGICEESVEIRRDRVRLQAGSAGGGIHGGAGDSIFVTGAADVEIIGLEITGPFGVFGDVGAGIRMQDCTIDVSGVGFGIQRGSSARIRDSEIAGASVGVEVGDSSGMRTDGTVTMTSQFGPALSVFRSAVVDLRGTVNVTRIPFVHPETGEVFEDALAVTGNSDLNNRSGLTTVTGNAAVFQNSSARFDSVHVTRDLTVAANSWVYVREATVDRNVIVFGEGLWNLLGTLTVGGEVACVPFTGGFVAGDGRIQDSNGNELQGTDFRDCPVACSEDPTVCAAVGPDSECLWGRCTF